MFDGWIRAGGCGCGVTWVLCLVFCRCVVPLLFLSVCFVISGVQIFVYAFVCRRGVWGVLFLLCGGFGGFVWCVCFILRLVCALFEFLGLCWLL